MNSILLGELTTGETTAKSAKSDTDVFEFYLRNGVLGTMIKQMRKKRNMTQSELGKLFRCSKSSNFKIGKQYEGF